MASVTHAFTNPKSDGGDATIVRPSDWNAAHVVTGLGNFTSTMSRFEDECFFGATADKHAGQVTQNASGTSAVTSSGGGTSVGNHPGVIQLSSGTTTTGRCALFGGEFYIAGGVVTFETVVALQQLSDGTNTFTARAGLMDTANGDAGDGVYVRYTHSVNSGKWQGVTRASSVETAIDLGATATSISGSSYSAAFIRLGFVINAAATSVQFYVNGSTAGSPVTTHIPSSAPFLSINAAGIGSSAGTSPLRNMLLDYYSLQFDFTSSR